MNVQKRNDVTIYNLSSGPTLPEWLGERARRNLSKRDENIRRRIELIQDLQMPSSSSTIKQTSNGRYVFVGGTYPPRIRCYDLSELTMKFERYLDADVVDIQLLSEDYGKLAILLDNRFIEFHAHYGKHESIRIPKFGRAISYEPTTCELLLAASGSQIYRLNLDEGRFSEPWSMMADSDDVSAASIAVCPTQPLASVGCDDGVVRFWDNRSPDTLLKPFLKLDVRSATNGYGFYDDDAEVNNFYNPHEISSMAYDQSGLYMAAGTAGGLVALYDIRSSKPLHIQEHKHGSKIHTVRFHSGSGCVVSSDEKIVKLWKYKSTGDLVNTIGVSSDRFDSIGTPTNNSDGGVGSVNSSIGAVLANVEGTSKFSNFLIAGDENDPTGNNSGVLLCTTDQPKLECYYVPKAGLAPKWCSFLENITEELEERDLKRRDGSGGDGTDLLVKDGQEAVFENYKFVSREDLDKLGVSDLIGTPMLRGYMHGFFMDINLYNRVRAVANPFEYEEYRKKKLKERLEAKRASRIAPKDNNNKKKKTAVNPDLAERLQDKADAGSDTKAGKLANRLLSDDRFGNLFTNPDYEIDEEDEDFKLRNPSGVAATKKKKNEDMDSDDDDDDDDDDESEKDNYYNNDTAGFHRVEGSDDDDDDDEEDSESDSEDSDSDDDSIRGGKVRGESYEQIRALRKNKKPTKAVPKKKQQSKKTVLYEAEDDDVIGGKKTSSNKALHVGLGKKMDGIDKMRKIKNMPLEKRFQMEAEEDNNNPIQKLTVGKGGSKELTYIPKDTKKMKKKDTRRDEVEGSGERGQKRQRRGIKDLKFKTPFKNR